MKYIIKIILILFLLFNSVICNAEYLRQSTAVTLKLGPFLDETDGITAETALTVTQADIRLTKNGGDFAQKNDANSATHDESGWYNVALDVTDTNTTGRLIIAIHESGALPVWHEYSVLEESSYDAFIGGTLLAAALIADAVWDEAITDHTTGTTFGGKNQHLPADIWSVETRALTDKAGFTISGTTTTLDALKTYGDSAWATAAGFSTHSAADVWTAATRALTDKADFTISGTTTTLDALKTYGDSVWATAAGFSTHSAADVWTAATRALTDKIGFTIAGTKTTLDALSTHGDLAWATAAGFSTHSAADIWTAATRALTDKAGFTISGTTTTLDALKTYGDSAWATAAGFSTHSAADVWTAATRALTDKAGFTISGTKTTLDALSTHGDSTWATAAGFSTHSAADIWNLDISAYSGVGYAGTYIKNLYDSQGDWITAAGFSTHSEADVWTTGSRELSTPADYKADVSSLALETTLTAMKGATFDTGTDSLEAIRNRGDTAWLTGGGDVPTVEEIRAEIDSNSTKLASILEDSNELQTNQNNWLTAAGFSTHNAAAVVTALMADVGITAGGTYTFEDFCKAAGAYILGTWQDKNGDVSIQEILDWEDDSTVILEQTASKTTPYKTTTKK